MTSYPSPLWDAIPLSLTLAAAIGVGIYAARNSTLTIRERVVVVEAPRNCTSCVDVLSSENTACRGCSGPEYPNYRQRV